ncbi:hypothetical protein AU210_014519 [Fusarium oxysporum f. sp. radicis-cucumerinum]|uniref:Uncharacterized protein n=1 Tax=Fusarium oxysporum f. sp. radicis-cucumerinum TaxID=327505 RepID=A0A2H3GM00_FUSOX|nr:hypothetical protein AU210_014519 [Fusarium oxysporum f. sp. radicis-cucumerinum]
MSTRYFDTVTSANVYDAQLKAEIKLANTAITIDDLQASGSNWGRRQLLACQVIVSPTAHNVLPAYIRHRGNEGRPESQEVQDFLNGPDPSLMHYSTHFLISEYGFSLGEMWAALASVKHYPRPRVVSSNEGTPEAKRVRRSTAREGYVNSAGFQISSSNPEDRSSPSAGSDGSGGPSYTEPEPTQELPAENSAVLLITRVLRHLLYYTQAPRSSRVVDFRPERRRIVSDISELEKQFVGIDDGGLSLKAEGGLSTEPNVAIALLEAKRRLVVDHGKPKISDECLAQMTCEAMLARLRPMEEQLNNERTIVINATSHYVCFSEFHITEGYIEDLQAGDGPSEPLKVTATYWFDLSDKRGRRGVLENIQGMYEDLVKQRERANRPRRHPIPGARNLPAERLYQRRLRDLTPALWFEDPYLVCVLLSLAQLQRQKGQTTPETFFVRLLVTNASDTSHAHVFQADIPSKLLHALDNPTEDMDNLVWPAIQHVQVPFKPHASFSERIAGQLLAGLKTRAEEEMPRGEKRKRDEMDTEEQTKSVKVWDGAAQVAAVPLANG